MHQAPISPPTRASRHLAPFASLAEPDYRLYWSGLLLYVIGHHAEYVTFGWLVWEQTRNPLFLGYLGLAQGIPTLLFQLFGGVFADRTGRLRLLVRTQLATGGTVAAALVLLVAGLMRVEYLLGLAALASSFRAFEQPSRMALIPHLISREKLANAVALGGIPWQSGRVLGPSIAGVLVATLGGAAGLAFAVLAYLGAIALYSRIRVGAESATGSGLGVLRNLLEGFAFVGRNSLFTSLIGLTFFNSIFGMSYVALLPIFADRYLDAGSAGYGLLQAASGVGAVGGTLTIAWIAYRLRRRGLFILSGGAGFGLLLVLFSQSSALFIALAVAGLMGFSNTFYTTLVNTTLQEHVPNQLRGRVMGIYGLCWNLIPIGGMLGGALAAAVDARFAVLAGGGMVAGLALLLLAGSPGLRSVELPVARRPSS